MPLVVYMGIFDPFVDVFQSAGNRYEVMIKMGITQYLLLGANQ
jgi:hypothetical protein